MIMQNMNKTGMTPGLEALMVLNKQANPLTPQGLPTIAAKTAQQMAPSPQQVAANTGTGNQVEMLQQQRAQQALMDAMKPQPQGPLQMAEGGIANLLMDDEEYADGGIIGYAVGGGPGFDMGETDEEADQERIRQLIESRLQEQRREEQAERLAEQKFIEQRAAATARSFNQPPQQAATTAAPLMSFPAGDAGYAGPTLTTADMAPSPAARVAPSPAPRMEAGIASGRVPSIAQLIKEATGPMDERLKEYKAPTQKTEQQLEEERRAVRVRRGLPEQLMSAEEKGLAALQEQDRQIRAFKEAEIARKAKTPEPGSDFWNAIAYGGQGGKGGFAEGLRASQRAAEAGTDAQQQALLGLLEEDRKQKSSYTAVEALIAKARDAEAMGDMNAANKFADMAREEANKIVMAKAEGAKSAISPAISAYGGMRQQQMQESRAAQQTNEVERLHKMLFPGQPMTLESIAQIKSALSPAIAERAAGREAANDFKRQQLLDNDQVYSLLRGQYINATDPAKKAEALRKMKEIERLKGIEDDGGMTAPSMGSAVDRNNPLLK